jgi:hypothetical protein
MATATPTATHRPGDGAAGAGDAGDGDAGDGDAGEGTEATGGDAAGEGVTGPSSAPVANTAAVALRIRMLPPDGPRLR